MPWGALALLMMQYVVIPCSQVANVGRMFVFGHTLLYVMLGEVATGHFVFVDVSRCERILPRSVEMRYRCVEP